MQNRSPRTSPRMSRRGQQQQSPGGHETSFNSYRSRDSEEEEEDEIDRSIPSAHRSRDSFGNLSNTGTPSSHSKSPAAGHYGRRGIKDPNSSRSPNEFKRSPKKTPKKSDVGSPHDQSRHSHSSGSPSLYPTLDGSDTSGLYPSLDEMFEDSPIKNKEQIRSTYMTLRPRPIKSSSKGTSPPKARPESPQRKNSSDSDSYNQILLIGVLALMAAGLFLWFAQAESPKKDVGSTLERFVKEQQELVKKFPGQEKRLWKTLSAATKRIINDEEPIQPAVILIGSTKSTRREADCIAQQFSKVVTEAFQSAEPVSVDVSKEYIAVSPDDAKVALERSLKNGFKGGAKSAVINSLEDLPGSTAMLLHAFCDNDNAPYTKVVILFTIHSDENYITDKDVEDQLTQIWKRHLNIDDISALLSRVANNIVIAKEEDKTVLQQHC